MASDPKVKTTQRDWATEVAMCDAQDAAEIGQQGVVALQSRAPYPAAYTFSNGRQFKEGKGPYG